MQVKELPPLPPKPPRYPPGLFGRRSVEVLSCNALAVGLNLYTAHLQAQSGNDFLMFGSCAAVSLSLWAFSIWIRRVRTELRHWAELHKAYAALVAARQMREENGND